MKTEIIADKLTGLTSNLVSPSLENTQQLDSIRRIIGYNLRNNRQAISASTLTSPGLEFKISKTKINEFEKYAVESLSEEDRFLVQRIGNKDAVPVVGLRSGDLLLPINPIERLDELRWNQKRGEQIGPFLTEEGRTIWFDFYYYEDKLTVRAQNGSIPNFLFSKARRSIWLNAFRDSETVRLLTGHVWILAKLFTNDAGDNEYVGFNIKEGSFTISNTKTWNGQYLDFDGKFTGKLTVKLVQPEKNGAVFEGCSAAQNIDFQYPDEINFEWSEGNLVNISGDDGKFTGYNNALNFSGFNNNAIQYEKDLNHILIPCQTNQAAWNADFSHSDIVDSNGVAEIKKSFWALSIVRVSNPATLGVPDHSGGWALQLSSDLFARWIGLDNQQPSVLLNDPWVLLYPQALLLYSKKTTVDVTSTNKITQEFLCWQLSPENTSRIPLSIRYRSDFPLIYYCHAEDGETLLMGCRGDMRLDRPVFAEGSLISLEDLSGWIIFRASGNEIKVNTLLTNPNALQQPAKPLALENALMIVSQPTGLVVEGLLSRHIANSIETGHLSLTHGLLRWKPTLPDPYVSNLAAGWERGERLGVFSSVLYALVSWTEPATPIVTFKGELPLSSSVQAKSPSNPEVKSLPVQMDEHALAQIRNNRINGRQTEEKKRIDDAFDNIEERLLGWKLLDVSTNMDLIGVSVNPSLFGTRDRLHLATISNSGVTNNNFVVKELALNTPLHMVHVFTVPQVQWEPVRTLPEDQNIGALGWFPEWLGSATDGGPTRLFGISQELSPIIPDIVVRQIRESFTQGNPTAALTSLSFGLKAVVQLSPKNSSSRNADAFEIVQPAFPQKQMKGGIQINLMAESGNPKSDNRSAGFEGFIAQTLNGYELFTGTELGLSVLGATFQPDASVETQFNKEFATGGTDPFVPVTRFDLSGYGASNFSEWDNPGALAQIGKVQFKIMVGRTAFEVVKFVSKIYPWGMTVTRSVTIERRSGGGVIRKDSGWQATKAGIFDFRTDVLPQPYTFRPGLFRGCFNTKNIRPASNDIIKYDDPVNAAKKIELAPVYFDADVQLDGQQNGNVFSRGILGFIQLSPKGETLSVDAFKKLVADQGAIGGPLDTILNIGNSGFRFRATRIEVDISDNAGAPNFVAVVRGQPVLPNNGAWSVVKMAAPGNTTDPQEATTADASRGTPLFIENSWIPPVDHQMKLSGFAGPYRFADPADFFVAKPRYDYGFMQNTGSQAFLFRRPKIEPGVSNEISSVLKPAFADLFAMTTSKGVFPPINNAIEFPIQYNKLQVQPGTNKLRLSSPVKLTNMRAPLIVEKAGTGQMTIFYDQSQLNFNLNFDDWSVDFDKMFFWTSMAGISNFFGNSFDLKAGTTRRAKLVNVKSLLKKEIRDALEYIPGMSQDNDVQDIDLGVTNSKKETTFYWGLDCSLEIDLATAKVESKCKALSGPEEEHEEEGKSKHSSIEIAFKAAAAKGEVPGNEIPPQWLSFAKLGIEFQAKIPVGGIVFIVLGLEAEIHWLIKPKPSESLEIQAYVGVGVGGSIGPFKSEAFVAAGLVFIYEDNTAKFGGLVMLKAEIDLFIAAVEVSAELKGVYFKGDDPDTPEVENVSLIEGSGEVAINVSIFLVINIHASYEYETIIRP